jgi:hypothetical protein
MATRTILELEMVRSLLHFWKTSMKDESHLPVAEQSLVYRLRKRAEIRRQIQDRRSVQEGQPDRIADLLEEAADIIEQLEGSV